MSINVDAEMLQMLRGLDEAMVEMAKAAFKVEGQWYYRDLPKMQEPYFSELIDVLGEDNIRWLTLAKYSDGTSRGQMIYNEQARLNTVKWLKNK